MEGVGEKADGVERGQFVGANACGGNSDQVWFITGGSRGFGRSVAEEALAAGHRVVATARRASSLDDLAAQYGDRLLSVPRDVTDPAHVESAVARPSTPSGALDVVGEQRWLRRHRTDRAGHPECFPRPGRRRLPRHGLRDQPPCRSSAGQGGGYFIQVTCVGGCLAAPGLGAYQAAKFAVEGFSSVLRREVSPLGIRVTLAEPGGMRTDWAGASMEIPEFDAAYEPTVGALAKHLLDRDGAD